MFNIGDTVVYSTTGICIIDDIRTEKFRDEPEEYYVLRPLFSRESAIFSPVKNTSVKMRHILTKNELDQALISSTVEEWIENDHTRKDRFNTIIRSCDLISCMSMLLSLLQKKHEKENLNKKLHANDEKFLCDIEKIVYGEISYIYNVTIEQATEIFFSHKHIRDY